VVVTVGIQSSQVQCSGRSWMKVVCGRSEVSENSARESLARSLSRCSRFLSLSLSRWLRPEERTGETLTIERLFGPEEELHEADDLWIVADLTSADYTPSL